LFVKCGNLEPFLLVKIYYKQTQTIKLTKSCAFFYEFFIIVPLA